MHSKQALHQLRYTLKNVLCQDKNILGAVRFVTGAEEQVYIFRVPQECSVYLWVSLHSLS